MSKNVLASINTQSLFDYEGFTVQRGMIYGTRKNFHFVTNGNLKYKATREPYYTVYIASVDGINKPFWHPVSIAEFDDTALFNAISRQVFKRNQRNISLEYLDSNEIESARWQQDPNKKHFQAHDPFATPKSVSMPNPKGSAIYNSIKERTTLTQRVNTMRYINGSVITII